MRHKNNTYYFQEAEPPKWFEEEEGKSTKVYVSGLPDTITDKQFEEIMSKCGMVEYDVRTKKAKLKIYKVGLLFVYILYHTRKIGRYKGS